MPIFRIIIFLLVVFGFSACSKSRDTHSTLNSKASIPDSFGIDFSKLKVITSLINKQEKTMSTLYGNELALRQAGSIDLVAGELFTLVTWKQQPDSHWFGANIPGELQSIEALETVLVNDSVTVDYKVYRGPTLITGTPANINNRIKFVLKQKPALMP